MAGGAIASSLGGASTQFIADGLEFAMCLFGPLAVSVFGRRSLIPPFGVATSQQLRQQGVGGDDGGVVAGEGICVDEGLLPHQLKSVGGLGLCLEGKPVAQEGRSGVSTPDHCATRRQMVRTAFRRTV
jgi:hypothetical protein